MNKGHPLNPNKPGATPFFSAKVENRRERAGRYIKPLMALALAALLVVLFFGDQGVLAYFELRQEKFRLRDELLALDMRQLELSQTVEALKTDSRYIEYLARRDLGLVYPDEKLMELRPPAKSQ